MIVEFKLRYISIEQQKRFSVKYKGNIIGEYIPDIVVDNKVIIELKTIDGITDHERGQVINYLKITGLRLGIIINFKKAKLEWERIVL